MYPYIAHALNTLFGMYQKKHNEEWDKKLNQLMEEEWETAELGIHTDDVPSINPDFHTIAFGKVDVWVSSKWFCHGYRYSGIGSQVTWWENSRPSIKTMVKLDRLVKYKLKEHNTKILKETSYE